jgi:hypothetical protein
MFVNLGNIGEIRNFRIIVFASPVKDIRTILPKISMAAVPGSELRE